MKTKIAISLLLVALLAVVTQIHSLSLEDVAQWDVPAEVLAFLAEQELEDELEDEQQCALHIK